MAFITDPEDVVVVRARVNGKDGVVIQVAAGDSLNFESIEVAVAWMKNLARRMTGVGIEFVKDPSWPEKTTK